MYVLVANLGSTSFKYRLYDMRDERQLARGGVERIGDAQSRAFVEIGDSRQELEAEAPDHAAAVRLCLSQLADPDTGCLDDASDVAAIGFKAVHGGAISGVAKVNEHVVAAMEEMNAAAPAHNPPYIDAMRLLALELPEIPLVAAFETGFHQTIPDRLRTYAVPYEWAEKFHIQRWGFHGASHRYIAERTRELLGEKARRVISCHLGGSSSLCAIRDGQSAATTMGMSPQTGLPQNNRTGDFDPFAIPVLMKATGETLDEVLRQLATESGLLGLSGRSGDVRDIEQAAAEGDQRSQLALDVFVSEIRRHLGGLMVELGGVDAIVFTGGIGENSSTVRAGVCRELEEFGVDLDEAKNDNAKGETAIHGDAGRSEIWVIPTNEEIIVARQTRAILEQG